MASPRYEVLPSPKQHDVSKFQKQLTYDYTPNVNVFKILSEIPKEIEKILCEYFKKTSSHLLNDSLASHYNDFRRDNGAKNPIYQVSIGMGDWVVEEFNEEYHLVYLPETTGAFYDFLMEKIKNKKKIYRTTFSLEQYLLLFLYSCPKLSEFFKGAPESGKLNWISKKTKEDITTEILNFYNQWKELKNNEEVVSSFKFFFRMFLY
jgi:hypothetical protein